jgi:hypothetical protein
MKCGDHFHNHSVFLAGFGSIPRKSSMMAYGTIISYSNFDKAWEEIKDDYSIDCWKEMCKYWIYQKYLSPIPLLLVSLIFRQLGIPTDQLLTNDTELQKILN